MSTNQKANVIRDLSEQAQVVHDESAVVPLTSDQLDMVGGGDVTVVIG
ncbi:hypothetical protein [Usitatibacter palustris]|uniref:Uncharacterized protein n=1 Tax=Usitatibacter palustris TaxID=2732487 RepID=A0A6M4H8E3_9PROT|nr:hypothetical protein [Usitatibacter palustris]QJR15098.1 hypothetical protein DSM104440_01915 [Usitatibacter palustris]